MSVKSELAILLLALILDDQVHIGCIFGGREAEPHSRPYMVYVKGRMQDGKPHNCMGFLVDEDFVMTAAHCQAKSYNVLLGVHKISKPTDVQTISVKQAFPNENYDASFDRNDIMLLKLSSKAHFNKNVQPIHLADGGDGSLPKSCSVAGWGSDRYPKSKTPVLMEVNVTLVEERNCYKEHTYCSEPWHVTQGDGGAPLVCEDGKAFGIVPSVFLVWADGPEVEHYTKIPDYKKWINSVYKKQPSSNSEQFICL